MRNIHLTPQLISAVRDAADIVAVASDHTRLTKKGRHYSGLCPLHKEKSPSFSVDPGKGVFYCFGCGVGGDAIKLHMLATGDDFAEAIEALALRYAIPLPAASEARAAKEDRGLALALEAAHEFFRKALQAAKSPRAYLAERQIPEALSERFGLGYAPDAWRDLATALERRIPQRDLEAAGLLARSERGGQPYDRFRNRLIFPIFAPNGRLVGFGGRTLGDDRAKYINTSETPEFHKGRLLYGFHVAKQAMRERGSAVLVEGYFDVLAVVASGRNEVAASMGTALTEDQARMFARVAEEVVVAYDGDNAGETAFRRAIPLLLAEGLAVRRAAFPGGHDPDSLRLEAGSGAVAQVLDGARDGVMLELERLIPRQEDRSPHHIAKAADAVAALLAPLKDPIIRREYGRRAAERLGIAEQHLWRRGGGVSPAPSRTPPPEKPTTREFGWTLEAQALNLLLDPNAERPPLADFPPPESFFDPVCRNIFQAFYALYVGAGEQLPSERALIDRLGADGAAVDRLARILLEKPVAPDEAGRLEPLEMLAQRWRRQRLKELAREMVDAQQQGHWARLEELKHEKTELSLRHHRVPDRGRS